MWEVWSFIFVGNPWRHRWIQRVLLFMAVSHFKRTSLFLTFNFHFIVCHWCFMCHLTPTMKHFECMTLVYLTFLFVRLCCPWSELSFYFDISDHSQINIVTILFSTSSDICQATVNQYICLFVWLSQKWMRLVSCFISFIVNKTHKKNQNKK